MENWINLSRLEAKSFKTSMNTVMKVLILYTVFKM